MKTKNTKERLFEIVGKLDKTFKPLNENDIRTGCFDDSIRKGTDQEIKEDKINEWDNYQGITNTFEDKLEEIFKEMIQSDYSYDDILSVVEKILQKQP